MDSKLIESIRDERLMGYLHSHVLEPETYNRLIGEILYLALDGLDGKDFDLFCKTLADNLENKED